MGQGGSKESSGSRQRKGQPYWHSLVSSSRTSTSSYDSRDSYPALIPCQRNYDIEAKLDEAVPNRFSRVFGCLSVFVWFQHDNKETNGIDLTLRFLARVEKPIQDIKKKVVRKESSFSQKTKTSTIEIPDEVSETPQPCQAVKGLDELVMCTNFSREELQLMYHGFKNDCPTGVIDRDTFKELYADLFPAGDSSSYGHFIFNTFDTNRDGIINFEDFAVGLSESLHGSIHEKLKWTFRLYDVDSDGLLRKEELLEVLDAVYRINLSASMQDLPGSSMSICEDLPIEQHIGQLFEALDKNNNGVVTEDDFIDACLADQSLLRSLAVANQFDDILEDVQEELDLSLSVDCSSKSSFGFQDFLSMDLSPRTACQNLDNVGHDGPGHEERPHAMSGDLELFEMRNERSYSCA